MPQNNDLFGGFCSSLLRCSPLTWLAMPMLVSEQLEQKLLGRSFPFLFLLRGTCRSLVVEEVSEEGVVVVVVLVVVTVASLRAPLMKLSV